MLKRMKDVKPMTLERLTTEYADRIYIHPVYTVQKVLCIKNGCCRDLPVLLTTNERPDGTTNYSCQCACGTWTTTGCSTAEEAIRHYERMSAGAGLYGGF